MSETPPETFEDRIVRELEAFLRLSKRHKRLAALEAAPVLFAAVVAKDMGAAPAYARPTGRLP